MAFQPTPLWNPTSTAPPWDWNPMATAMSAYYTVQKSQQDRKSFELEQEVEQYLIPIKKQSAQLSLEKAMLDLEKTKAEIERQRAYTRQARSLYGTTDMDENNQSNSTSSRWGPARYGAKTTPTPTSTPAASPKPKPKWSVVKPAATSTGP